MVIELRRADLITLDLMVLIFSMFYSFLNCLNLHFLKKSGGKGQMTFFSLLLTSVALVYLGQLCPNQLLLYLIRQNQRAAFQSVKVF